MPLHIMQMKMLSMSELMKDIRQNILTMMHSYNITLLLLELIMIL